MPSLRWHRRENARRGLPDASASLFSRCQSAEARSRNICLADCIAAVKRKFLAGPIELVDGLDIRRRCALGVELGGKPCVHDGLGQFRPDDARTHGDDLGVVGLGRAFRRIGVMRQRRADARHLVGRNAHADPRAADEDAAVIFAVLHLVGEIGREVGIEAGLAQIRDAVLGLRLQMRLDHVEEGLSGAVGTQCDFHDFSPNLCVTASMMPMKPAGSQADRPMKSPSISDMAARSQQFCGLTLPP